MDLVASVTGVAAAVVGDLPSVVARRTHFEQQALVLPQREELADAPVESEVVTRRDVEVPLLAVRFVGQHGDDRRALVVHRIPRGRALNLVGPETVANAVGGLGFYRDDARYRAGLR